MYLIRYLAEIQAKITCVMNLNRCTISGTNMTCVYNAQRSASLHRPISDHAIQIQTRKTQHQKVPSKCKEYSLLRPVIISCPVSCGRRGSGGSKGSSSWTQTFRLCFPCSAEAYGSKTPKREGGNAGADDSYPIRFIKEDDWG